MIELKRVSIDLASKHLRQAAGYAINIGCEWIVLTNGRDWRLFHVTYAKPPETKMVSHWNLLEDEMSDLAERFRTISYKNVKRG